MSACGLLLAGQREVGYAFHVADHARQVVGVAAAADGAFAQVAFVDVPAVVANGVGDVEREVVASLLCGHAQQLAVLGLREVLFEVHVQRRAAREVGDVALAVEAELVEDVERCVFDGIEVAVVAVARHVVARFAVPFGVLDAHVLGGDHLAVEHDLSGTVLLVAAFDEPQNLLHEVLVLGVVVDAHAEVFGRLDQTVHPDGEVLAAHVDVARVEEREHAFRAERFQILVVGELHLVHEFRNLFEELQIGDVRAPGVLDAAVEVDREHALRAGGDAARTERIAESVVLNFVAQTAARRERVGVVAHVGEERVPGGVHLGREIGPLAVDRIAVAGQQRHRLDGEGQHGLRALGVEPAHEAFLEPAQRLPVRARTVRKTELAEETLEVGAVVVGDVPEDGLEVACARGLVDRVDDLLETVGDDLVDRAAAFRKVGGVVGSQVVVLAVLLFDEIVEVHQKFGRGAGAREHRRDDEDHVDEAAAERLEVGRGRRVAADGLRAAQQPRIHRDRGAVVGQRRLVVLVDEVVVEQLQIAVRELLAVHLLQAVGQQAPVQADEVLLGQLADQGGDVLVLDVGVGVEFRARRRVFRFAVVQQEPQLVAHFAVFEVALAVEHEGFGHSVVLLGHERRFDLILNLLDGHPVGDADAAQDARHHLLRGETAHREEGFGHGVADFVDRERLAFAVAFGDE